MNASFIDMCKRYVEFEGIPWTTVSKKTGIPYNRLRGLRSGNVSLTLDEFIRLGAYCKQDCAGFVRQELSGNPKQAS